MILNKKCDLSLNRGAVSILSHHLQQPGWTDNESAIWLAGEVLEDPAMMRVSGPQTEPEATEWCSAPVTLAVTEKQRAVLKACVHHAIKTRSILIGQFTNVLMRALGLAPEA